jgi:hypothetical protein
MQHRSVRATADLRNLTCDTPRACVIGITRLGTSSRRSPTYFNRATCQSGFGVLRLTRCKIHVVMYNIDSIMLVGARLRNLPYHFDRHCTEILRPLTLKKQITARNGHQTAGSIVKSPVH